MYEQAYRFYLAACLWLAPSKTCTSEHTNFEAYSLEVADLSHFLAVLGSDFLGCLAVDVKWVVRASWHLASRSVKAAYLTFECAGVQATDLRPFAFGGALIL